LVRALETTHDVLDLGDMALPALVAARDASSGLIDPRGLVTIVEGVRQLVLSALAADRFALVIGGDCPLLLGCLAAARQHAGPPGLLFVDGHEDCWPPHQSPTGEAADMELGLALGLTQVEDVPELSALLPLGRLADTALVGPRDIADLAAGQLPSLVAMRDLAGPLHYYPADAVHGRDLLAQVTRALRPARAAAGGWWLHTDLDALSTEALPAVDYPLDGGLSWGELEVITGAALAASGVLGWDITIYNPDLDPTWAHAERITAYIVRSLARCGT